MTSPDDEKRDEKRDEELDQELPAEAGVALSTNGASAPHYRDDRDLWEGPQDGPRAIKLIQGYVWHPREQELALDERLSSELGGGVHVLVDAMPQAPFSFFEDGTLSATQQVYQLTVVAIVEPGTDPARLLPEVAERLQAVLEETPAGVGWQLMEDLREVG